MGIVVACKWMALALLWVAFFLQQGTWQIFGATLSSIQGSLGVSAAQIGMVVTVLTFAYGLSVPFAGLTADLLNRKWMVVSGVFVFCLGIFASGFASCLGLMLVSYGILNGFGQSFYCPSATSIIGELHKETRATALSILQMGFYAGIIGVSAVSGYLAEAGADGWRTPFWVFGGIGIAWAVILALGLKNKRSDRFDVVVSDDKTANLSIVWTAYAPSLLACGIAMAFFGVFRGVYDSNLMASLFDIIPQMYHASGAGLMLSCAFVFGSTSPVVLGTVKDAFSSTAALASLAAFYIVGAGLIVIARWRAFGRFAIERRARI